ncbi:hypothetical protein [Enorma phocaeensis]|uniref:hypothetical protein n=1 Tax=Enorma phocaeensis TaxID=1871019 RepID=UPI00195A3393|nr:hypothetical protein [Enorma phocaeensis]MBM6953008.1 hypothetical protein [Enorma phocaeensis]
MDVHYGDLLVRFGSILDLGRETLPHIADDGIAAKLTCDRLRDGDIVVADTAEDPSAGKCSELRGVGGSTVFSGLHTMPLRPLREYAPLYLGHYLNAPVFRKQLAPLMQGIKVISVSRTAMSGAIMSVPSVEEQDKIAELLTLLDDLIALHQRKQAFWLSLLFYEVFFSTMRCIDSSDLFLSPFSFICSSRISLSSLVGASRYPFERRRTLCCMRLAAPMLFANTTDSGLLSIKRALLER